MSQRSPSAASLANGWRFDDKQNLWFDFYNCRVALPERGVYFYAMPYATAGSDVDPAIGGCLTFYDGGNGGRGRVSDASQIRIGREGWRAASDRCHVRWRSADGEEQLFAEDRIRLSGPSTRWDVRIEPYISDRSEPETDPRRLRLEERGLLRRAPFIHRVPRMKGFASGWIEQDGERHEFERGIVYQAKNHGTGFPNTWTWLQANDFEEDEGLAFEVAALEDVRGSAAMLRIARPGDVQLLNDWSGDEVHLERRGDEYHFFARSADGRIFVEGDGRHAADRVIFRYATPTGRIAENDESFVGTLTVQINERRFSARMPALGRLSLLDAAV